MLQLRSEGNRTNFLFLLKAKLLLVIRSLEDRFLRHVGPVQSDIARQSGFL